MNQFTVSPDDFGAVHDGQTDDSRAVRRALAHAKERGIRRVCFSPADYRIGEDVITLYGETTYDMRGTRFLADGTKRKDCYLFEAENAAGMTLLGGEIIGNPDWSRHNIGQFKAGTREYINIGGVRIKGGGTRELVIDGLCVRDLTSAGILVISKDKQPASGIRIRGCNVCRASPNYADYLTERPAGALACGDWDNRANIFIKNAADVEISDCIAAESNCDGLTLENCRGATVTGCFVTDQHMGGLVLIGGRDIAVTNCVVRGNGSRGITIEAVCEYTTVTGCTVFGNGREGCWIDRGCRFVTLSGIVFSENGRKSDTSSVTTYPGNKTAHIRATCGRTREKNAAILITGCQFATHNQRCSLEVEPDSTAESPVVVSGCTFIHLPKTERPEYPARESVLFIGHIQAAPQDSVLQQNTEL